MHNSATQVNVTAEWKKRVFICSVFINWILKFSATATSQVPLSHCEGMKWHLNVAEKLYLEPSRITHGKLQHKLHARRREQIIQVATGFRLLVMWGWVAKHLWVQVLCSHCQPLPFFFLSPSGVKFLIELQWTGRLYTTESQKIQIPIRVRKALKRERTSLAIINKRLNYANTIVLMIFWNMKKVSQFYRKITENIFWFWTASGLPAQK